MDGGERRGIEGLLYCTPQARTHASLCYTHKKEKMPLNVGGDELVTYL